MNADDGCVKPARKRETQGALQNADFRYVGTFSSVKSQPPADEPLFLGRMPIPKGATAEWFGTRIESNYHPRTAEGWREGIAQVPDELREAVKVYLRGRWALLEKRARLAQDGGKRSATADAELAKMAEHVRKL